MKRVSHKNLIFVFLKLGALGFGGPYALLALMEKELVSQRRWLTPKKMPGMSIMSLVTANRAPRAEISKRSMGIFVVDQAPMKMMTFLKLAPFLTKTAATGKAA